MAPVDLRRPFKRKAVSDQQKRRDLTLQRQVQSRRDAQQAARFLASSVVSLQSNSAIEEPLDIDVDFNSITEEDTKSSPTTDINVVQASKLRGAEGRKWFAKQLMLFEWMIDVPDRLSSDWYVFTRPSGKRCFVVSSNGMTISRVRNGSILHRFSSALPNGSKARGVYGPSHCYSILDCIFHEADQTYYVIDMLCWKGYSLYDCAYEFRLYWLNSKLGESGACNIPSDNSSFRFIPVHVYNCDQNGLLAAYNGVTPFVKDGLVFHNKHAHYEAGNTPLALVWKDEKCSQFVIDTDSKGNVPSQQMAVLELQEDGRLVTSDEPPVVLGSLTVEFIKDSGIQVGNLLRFAVVDGGLRFVDGKLENIDLVYVGKANRAKAFADSFSKVLFQHMARHSPMKVGDLLSSILAVEQCENADVDMVG